ncbi:MAG: hypothetical protein BAJALOKI1v1_730008 [Promethearchaeota archaeon]|nr:MAG: hypothetical protein BAJALOKI1v1_730008 [Candidatus Lokiarchaeota archaeon]
MNRYKRRIEQLKFIASMFRMAMEEMDKVFGPESIRTIFRLIGERQGEQLEKQMKKKLNIDTWTPEKFAKALIEEIIDPAIGTDQSHIEKKGDELIVNIRTCPFKRAGIDIKNKFYCTYTEGLIETAAKCALGDVAFNTEDLISTKKTCCIFKIKLN